MTTAISLNAISFSQADRDPETTTGCSRLRLASRSPGHENRPSAPVHLTRRQLEVLALLCEGLPNKLICRRLGIAPGTAKAHISSILRELGVGSRLQAVVAARAQGLLNHDVEDAEHRHGTSGTIKFKHLAGPGRFQRHP
ncbi:MAG TPA: response regulator transcription factor [Burkholderiales bacterium]|nr:response regulator transcription factor [Burkholderiales bacterium]